MHIRALKPFYGEGNSTDPGDVIEVSHNRGKQLVAKGYAIEVGDGPVVPQAKKATAANDNKPETDKAEATEVSVPFQVRQTGGWTGEDKQQSASREDRPQRKRRSTLQKDDAE